MNYHNRMGIHGVIQRAEDLPGCWIAWCPELDVCTQGEHADHATAMLEDAIRGVIPECLSAFSFDRDGYSHPKRVMHPLRLGSDRQGDDLWPTFDDFKHARGDWRRTAHVELSQFDSELAMVPIAIVHGSLWWNVRSGIVSTDVSLNEFAEVPAARFTGRTHQKIEREVKGDVPLALLVDDAPLRCAGMSRGSIAEQYIAETFYRGEQLYQWSVVEEVSDAKDA